jgi:hypothetical protein
VERCIHQENTHVLHVRYRIFHTSAVLQHFEVFTAVKIQVTVFWVMTPRSVVVGYQSCLHLQGKYHGFNIIGFYVSLL